MRRAKRATSSVGVPSAPNGRKVTGAAASAAASAAVVAQTRLLDARYGHQCDSEQQYEAGDRGQDDSDRTPIVGHRSTRITAVERSVTSNPPNRGAAIG